MPRLKNFFEFGRVVARMTEVRSRDFLLDTWVDLVNTTPVKTGKARASWFISPGIPKTRQIPDGTYGVPDLPNLNKYKRNWQQWYISNTAPYISKLNQGSSKQAPVGFIEAAIQRNMVRYG